MRLSSCLQAQAIALWLTLAPVTLAQDVASECDALLARYARAGWSGAALVARDGKELLARGYGKADLEGLRANDENTLFEIASLSKQFTAAAILKLEQQGKLSLDDSIDTRLPGVPAHSKKITIQQLLTHTSGVPRENTAGNGEDLEAAVKAYLADGPKEKPGAHFAYWNGGYALLAGIVERASGVSFTAYCERELFAPAGMQDTGFTGDTDLPAERAAIGRTTSGAPRSALEHPYRSYGYQYRGMGGVVTSVRDLFKWDRALAGDGVLGEKARKRLFSVAKDNYACGWYVMRADSGGERQSHGGSVRGFACDFRRLPAAQACVVVLSNTDDVHAWELGENLECLLFGRPLRYPAPESVALTPEALASFAGNFATKGGRLVVRVDAGVLLAGIEGQALLDALAPSRKGSWGGDPVKLGQTALEIVQAIAKGNVEPLRAQMAKRIDAEWPDDVRTTIYPQYEKDRGPLKQASILGTAFAGDRVEIFLALAHERASGRVKVAFSSAGLEQLDWKGPEFPATLRLLPQGGERFECAGTSMKRAFDFVRKNGRVTGLKTKGLEFRREG